MTLVACWLLAGLCGKGMDVLDGMVDAYLFVAGWTS